jgi:hypothetical protein
VGVNTTKAIKRGNVKKLIGDDMLGYSFEFWGRKACYEHWDRFLTGMDVGSLDALEVSPATPVGGKDADSALHDAIVSGLWGTSPAR